MSQAATDARATDYTLPLVRVPIVDTNRELVAYELQFQQHADDNDELMHHVLHALTDGTLAHLTSGNRVFIRLSRDIVVGDADPFKHNPHLGVIVTADIADDDILVERLQQLALRHRQVMLDLGRLTVYTNAKLDRLLRIVQNVRVDITAFAHDRLIEAVHELNTRGVSVFLNHVDDLDAYLRCKDLPLRALQGQFLLKPDLVRVQSLSANETSLLRLMRALQDGDMGPVEIGEIIRDDAVLSYKLLGCVNSSYFGLTKSLKSVQQAAIFFGVSRMKNWIYTMALVGRSGAAPELLRASLIRARMFEHLCAHLPAAQKDMAFSTGILSLLDAMMHMPMRTILEHLPLAPEITDSLLERKAPYGHLITLVEEWEAGKLHSSEDTSPSMSEVALAYTNALMWCDHVYSFASGSNLAA